MGETCVGEWQFQKMKPPMDLPLLLLLLFSAGAAEELQANLDTSKQPHAWVFGLLKLPVFGPGNRPGPACKQFADVCALEAEGSFHQAMEAYESRLPSCGLLGWNRTGRLGSGYQATVTLRRSPCGLRLATKSPHDLQNAAHVQMDCDILQQLSEELGTPHCPACFPQAYYYSNTTGVCYQEFVPSVDIAKYLTNHRANTTAGFAVLKRVFGHALGMLAALANQRVRHNDLSFRNMLIRVDDPLTPNDASHAGNILVVDFGAALSAAIGHVVPGSLADFVRLGNRGHSDCFTVACQFHIYLYSDRVSCRLKEFPSPPAYSADESTFDNNLVNMMLSCSDPNGYPDFAALWARLRRVTRV